MNAGNQAWILVCRPPAEQGRQRPRALRALPAPCTVRAVRLEAPEVRGPSPGRPLHSVWRQRNPVPHPQPEHHPARHLGKGPPCRQAPFSCRTPTSTHTQGTSPGPGSCRSRGNPHGPWGASLPVPRPRWRVPGGVSVHGEVRVRVPPPRCESRGAESWPWGMQLLPVRAQARGQHEPGWFSKHSQPAPQALWPLSLSPGAYPHTHFTGAGV